MTLVPTFATAALAGVWTSLGMIPFELWLRSNAPESDSMRFLIWILAALVFLAMPGYLLVVGREKPFRKDWLQHPAERARYLAILQRIGIWLVCAAIVALLWARLLPAARPV